MHNLVVLQEYLSSSLVFSGIRDAQSLVVCIVTVVYPIRNGHFKMGDCTSSKKVGVKILTIIVLYRLS